MKWLSIFLGLILVLILSLSFYLQPNSLALCPHNNGEPVTRDGCQAAEAIVAVSGGDTTARTNKAVELYKKNWAPLIIFSGAAEDKTGPSNAWSMRQQAIEAGVPATAILIEELSENTKQNAQKTKELLAKYNIEDILLVTSGYHQRRANLEFTAYAEAPEVAVRNAPTDDKDWGWWWWLTPRGWYLALSEFGRIALLYLSGGL